MTSSRQVAANRLNARKSTGPRTLRGKRRSRRNALRHGLTAETVIDAFEDAEDYQVFHRQFISALNPRSAVEEQLIGRLVSILWRLRRATAIEAGLFTMHGEAFRSQGEKPERDYEPSSRILRSPVAAFPLASVHLIRSVTDEKHSPRELTQAFLRLCNLSGEAFDLLGRYEVMLWRQAMQILFLLGRLRPDATDRFTQKAGQRAK